MLCLLPFVLKWSSALLKLCHHKVMLHYNHSWLGYLTLICVRFVISYCFAFASFLWSQLPQRKSPHGSSRAAPHLEPILVTAYISSPKQNLFFLFFPLKLMYPCNCICIMENVTEAEKYNFILDHRLKHINSKCRIQEVTYLVCNYFLPFN